MEFPRNLERNRGGNYSGSERERRLRRLFESLDTDGDGVLSKEELGAADGIEEGTFEKLDTDGDGELTQEEFDDIDFDDI